MSINYRKETINVRDLILKPRIEIFDFIYQNKFHYSNESKAFEYYEIPVVTSDYKILSHIEDIIAAHTNQKETMEIIVADGLDENLAIRLAFKSIYFTRVDAEHKLKLITHLTTYLRDNPEGQKWANELEARGLMDINDKLGEILTCHKETIKYRKRITNAPSGSPKINLENLYITMDSEEIKIEYEGNKVLLKKDDYIISHIGKCIVIKMPLIKMGSIL